VKGITLRILIYGLNFAPELTGIGKYTGEMASWLSARGHDVRVVAAPPYYPAWRIRDDYRGNFYGTECVDGEPTVCRIPLFVPERPTGIKRMVHLLSFMLGSLPVMLREIFHRPDIVFTVEPTLFGAPLAILVARASNAVSWLHVQDFEVDAAFDLGLLPADGFTHWFALALERFFMGAFTRVSSISLKMVERTQNKGVLPANSVLFPNWVDIDHIYPLDTPNQFRIDLGLEDKIVLLYSGNMGGKQGLEVLVPLADAFSPAGSCADPRVHFLFCGDGSFRPQFEALVAHLPNVTLLPLQPHSRLNELLNAADIHLLPQRADAADLVMPSKLTGILASGRPVIATADPGTQVAQAIDNANSPWGCTVPTGDADALQSAVVRLSADPELRQTFGANAREHAVRHLCREEVLMRFERDLYAAVPAMEPHRAQVS